MKKFFSIFFSLLMCLTMFSTNALAASSQNITESENLSAGNDDVLTIWETLKVNGDLTVSTNGLLVVNDENEFVTCGGYPDFLCAINLCNQSIIDGILVADNENVEIASVIIPDEESVPLGLISGNRKSEAMPRNVAHGCSIQALDLLTMCENNYQTLSDYYYQMLRLSVINPNLSPWGATVGFWIGKVAEGGDWDYKVQPGVFSLVYYIL